MRLNPKKIWLIAVIVSSVCLLALLITLVVFFLAQNNSDRLSVWPQDEVRELTESNLAAINQAEHAPINTVRAIDDNDHLSGSLKAKAQLIVYLDFDCPYCASFNKILQQLTEQYGKDLVIAYRHFPLDSHPDAVALATAFECATEQGKMIEAKDYFYDIKRDRQDKDYRIMAETLKLDQNKFQACRKSDKYLAKINADKAEAKSVGVIGTPTSFLNGLILPGAYKIEDFKSPDGSDNQGLKSLIERELLK